MNRLFWFVWVGLFPMKLDDLPRQARDRHRESSNKTAFRTGLASQRELAACAEPCPAGAGAAGLARCIRAYEAGRRDGPAVGGTPTVCLYSAVIYHPSTRYVGRITIQFRC